MGPALGLTGRESEAASAQPPSCLRHQSVQDTIRPLWVQVPQLCRPLALCSACGPGQTPGKPLPSLPSPHFLSSRDLWGTGACAISGPFLLPQVGVFLGGSRGSGELGSERWMWGEPSPSPSPAPAQHHNWGLRPTRPRQQVTASGEALLPLPPNWRSQLRLAFPDAWFPPPGIEPVWPCWPQPAHPPSRALGALGAVDLFSAPSFIHSFNQHLLSLFRSWLWRF